MRVRRGSTDRVHRKRCRAATDNVGFKFGNSGGADLRSQPNVESKAPKRKKHRPVAHAHGYQPVSNLGSGQSPRSSVHVHGGGKSFPAPSKPRNTPYAVRNGSNSSIRRPAAAMPESPALKPDANGAVTLCGDQNDGIQNLRQCIGQRRTFGKKAKAAKNLRHMPSPVLKHPLQTPSPDLVIGNRTPPPPRQIGLDCHVGAHKGRHEDRQMKVRKCSRMSGGGRIAGQVGWNNACNLQSDLTSGLPSNTALISRPCLQSCERQPGGFSNLGNTCYMNSTLQALLALPPFDADLCSTPLIDHFKLGWVMNKSHRHNDSSNQSGASSTFSRCADRRTPVFAQTLAVLHKLAQHTERSISLFEFRKAIVHASIRNASFGSVAACASGVASGRMKDAATHADEALAGHTAKTNALVTDVRVKWASSQQQDAHEFLTHMLSLMHDEFSNECKRMQRLLSMQAEAQAVAPGQVLGPTPGREQGQMKTPVQVRHGKMMPMASTMRNRVAATASACINDASVQPVPTITPENSSIASGSSDTSLSPVRLRTTSANPSSCADTDALATPGAEKLMPLAPCTPVTRSFALEVQRTLCCTNANCAYKRTRTESFHNLSIDINTCAQANEDCAATDCDTSELTEDGAGRCNSIDLTQSNRRSQKKLGKDRPVSGAGVRKGAAPATVPQLLQRHFMQQKLDLRCEREGCTGITVDSSLKLSSLPRVLVVHLKRFKLAPLHDAQRRASRSKATTQYSYVKDLSRVVVPPVIDLRAAGLCADTCEPPQSNFLSSSSNQGVLSAPESDLGVAVSPDDSRCCALGSPHPELEPLLKRLPPLDEHRVCESPMNGCQNHMSTDSTHFGQDKDLEEALMESLRADPAASRERSDLEQAIADSIAEARKRDIDLKPSRTSRCVNQASSAAYRLQSVICHHGKRAFRGHYTADVRSRDGRWRRCDDSNVTFVNETAVLREAQVQGYILFYTQLQESETETFVRGCVNFRERK